MNHYEIEASVIKAKQGRPEELAKILEQYKGYVYKAARKYKIRNYELEDMVQIGYISLINAVSKYNPGTHAFTAYAVNAINKNFFYLARQNAKYQKDLSLNIPRDSEDSSSGEYMDLMESPENVEEDVMDGEIMRELKGAVERLSAEELVFIISVYYNKSTIKTYALKKGLTYRQALDRRSKILKKLREYMG